MIDMMIVVLHFEERSGQQRVIAFPDTRLCRWLDGTPARVGCCQRCRGIGEKKQIMKRRRLQQSNSPTIDWFRSASLVGMTTLINNTPKGATQCGESGFVGRTPHGELIACECEGEKMYAVNDLPWSVFDLMQPQEAGLDHFPHVRASL